MLLGEYVVGMSPEQVVSVVVQVGDIATMDGVGVACVGGSRLCGFSYSGGVETGVVGLVLCLVGLW